MFSLAKKLSLTVRGVMASAIDNLFTALKGRATYSENIADSKQVVKDIDNYELLDKASILLTPTAYSDARVHSVKTYIGDELVTNGGFSDGINDWTNNASATLSTENDKLKVSVSGAGSGYGQQNIIGLTIGATYKISAEGEIGTSTRLALYTPNAGFNNLYSDGAISTFFSATSTTENLRLYVYDDGAYGFWDNISIVDVSSDFDFDRASSATRINSDGLVQDMQSITDPELVLNGDFEELGDEVYDDDITAAINGGTWVDNGDGTFTVTGDGSPNEGIGVRDAYADYLTNGKTYKWTVEGDNVTLALYDDSYALVTSGTSPLYFTATATNRLYISPTDGVSATYSNVSIKQVDPNDRWSVGAKWTIANGVARLVSSDSSSSGFIQSSVFTIGNTYNITFDATVVSGEAKLESAGGGTLIEIDETKTYNHTFVADRTDLYFNRITSVSDISLDNISVKDITFSEDVDLARINYDSNGENGHWLLEPTSTNLIPYSEDFSQWSNARTTDTSNQATSPDGTNNATYFEQNSGETTAGSVYVSSTISSGTNTLSVFAKKKEKDFIVLYDTNAARTYFDLNNGSVGTTPSGVTANIENYGNGWYRCSVTFTVSSSGAQNTAFYLADNDSAAPIADSGGIYIWGAQLEALSYATSYIPTYGSTVTRATETLTGSGNSTLINSTEGVLYAEISALANDGTNRLISLSDGTADERVFLQYSSTDNRVQFLVKNNNTTQCNIIYDATDLTVLHKIAAKYKENDFALWVDGVEIGTDTSGTVASGLNQLQFDRGYSGLPFYGKCKALAVFDEALTDDELELLTGITNYGSFNELAQANGYTII